MMHAMNGEQRAAHDDTLEKMSEDEVVLLTGLVEKIGPPGENQLWRAYYVITQRGIHYPGTVESVKQGRLFTRRSKEVGDVFISKEQMGGVDTDYQMYLRITDSRGQVLLYMQFTNSLSLLVTPERDVRGVSSAQQIGLVCDALGFEINKSLIGTSYAIQNPDGTMTIIEQKLT